MRDDLGVGATERFDGMAGAVAGNRWDEREAVDQFSYQDALDRARDLLGSLPVTILLAASAAGLSIGVFLTNYQ